MKLPIWIGACLVAVATQAMAATPVVPKVGFDDVHVSVSDPGKAGAWYVKYLGATATQTPTRVSFGSWLVIFGQNPAAKPSAQSVIDHIGLSFGDISAKIKELEAAGAKVIAPVRDAPGLFKYAYVEDPWGIKIELVQDTDLAGFHHVHVNVPDTVATLKWFEDTFGGERTKLRGLLEGLRYSGVWLFATATKPGEQRGASRDHTIRNIGLRVTDAKAAAAALTSAGQKVTRGPSVTRVEGKDVGFLFVDDPNGIEIEMVQRFQ